MEQNLGQLLTKFFEDTTELTFKEGDEFEYEEPTETIFYPHASNYKDPHDDLFREVCESFEPGVSKYNIFMLGLFHEIGHSMSNYMISDRDWAKYEKLVDKIAGHPTDEDYVKYYNSAVEQGATGEGMAFLMSLPEEDRDYLEKITSEYIK